MRGRMPQDGVTPLINAALEGYEGVVRALLEAKADATMKMKVIAPQPPPGGGRGGMDTHLCVFWRSKLVSRFL